MIGIRHQRHYGSTPLIILKGDEHGDEQAKKNRKKLNIKVIKEKTKKRNRGKEKRKLPPLFI